MVGEKTYSAITTIYPTDKPFGRKIKTVEQRARVEELLSIDGMVPDVLDEHVVYFPMQHGWSIDFTVHEDGAVSAWVYIAGTFLRTRIEPDANFYAELLKFIVDVQIKQLEERRRLSAAMDKDRVALYNLAALVKGLQ